MKAPSGHVFHHEAHKSNYTNKGSLTSEPAKSPVLIHYGHCGKAIFPKTRSVITRLDNPRSSPESRPWYRAIPILIYLLLFTACGAPRTIPPAAPGQTPATWTAAGLIGEGRLRLERPGSPGTSCRIFLRAGADGAARIALLEDTGVLLAQGRCDPTGTPTMERAVPGLERAFPPIATILHLTLLAPPRTPTRTATHWRDHHGPATRWYGGDPVLLRHITGPITIHISDYRPVHDRLLPHHVQATIGGGMVVIAWSGWRQTMEKEG